MADPNPTLARRRLSVRLRALRERDGRSLTDLAEHLSVSLAQASRLDTGARGFKGPHVAQLADWYAVTGADRDHLLSLAAESQKRAWWQQVELPDSYRTLIGLEQAAESISEYCGAVIPGLLQTPDYARAAALGGALGLTEEQVAQAVDVRTRRQRVLARSDPPHLWVVIDEAALARTTGGVETMTAQLEHLAAMAATPRVTVQVIGFETGVHLGSTTSHFILLGMGEGLPDVLYQEGQGDPTDSEAEDEVAACRQVWDMTRAIALDPVASLDRVHGYLHRLR